VSPYDLKLLDEWNKIRFEIWLNSPDPIPGLSTLLANFYKIEDDWRIVPK
jgi:hypothetical protein